MKKWLMMVAGILFALVVFTGGESVHAQNTTHTVKSGDTLWKISKRYKVGLSEIINANPQFNNPDLIYPGDVVTIPRTAQGAKQVEQQVIQLTNQERAKYGLKALSADWQLSRVARYKSHDMRDRGYFSHQSPTYGSPFDMMKNFNINYRAAAENIAAGQPTPQAVVKAWMDSPGHRKNILNPDMTHIGVGYAEGGSYGQYWTQMFIRK